MNTRPVTVLALACLCCLWRTPTANAQTLVLCGVLDNSPEDTNPILGIIETFCSTGTGFFNGTAEEIQAPNSDKIFVRGRFSGSGTLTVSNNYNIGPWIGFGPELVHVSGTLEGPLAFSAGGEFITGTATASTFSNNSASTTIAFPNPELLPKAFADQDVRLGVFGGQGVLTGTLSWDAKTGVFVLPASGEFGIAAPEPTSAALMAPAIAWFLGIAWRRKRSR